MVNKENCEKVLKYIPESPEMIGFYDLRKILSRDISTDDLRDILNQLADEGLIIKPKPYWYQRVEKGFEDKTKKHNVPLIKTDFRISKDKKWLITKTTITDIKPISYIKKVIE